jgi:tape measure domain-containing protein
MADRLVITIDGNSTGLTAALASAERRLDSFNTRVSNSSRALTRVLGQMSSFGGSVNEVAAANARLAAAITRTATSLNQMSTSMTRAGSAARSAAGGFKTFHLTGRDLIMTLVSINTIFYTTTFLFGGIVKSTIEANSRFERMNVMLKNISGAADEAHRNLMARTNMNYIWDLADKAPFSIDNLSAAFVKLKSNGIDPTSGSLKAMVDAIAHFGGNSENLERASTAISQMLSKGTVQMEDLKGQLAETGGVPSAIRDMAKAAGFAETNMAGFFKAMKKGAVDSSTVIPKLFEVWNEKFGGSAAQMMNTWEGLMTRLSNAWQKMVVRVSDPGKAGSIFKPIRDKLQELITFMSTAQGDKFLRDLLSGVLGLANSIANGIMWLYKYRDAILGIVKAFVYLWAMSKVLSLVKSITMLFINFLLIAPRIILFWRTLANVANGAQLIVMLFGRNAAAAAAELGLLNAAGQISIGTLGALAAIAAAVSIAFIAIGAAYIYYSNKAAEAKARSDELHASIATQTERRLEAADADRKARTETDNLSVAENAALVKTANLTGQVDLLSSAYGRLAVEAKRARLEIMQTDLRKAESDYTSAVNARNDKYKTAVSDNLRSSNPGPMTPNSIGAQAIITGNDVADAQRKAWQDVNNTQEQKDVNDQFWNLNSQRKLYQQELRSRVTVDTPVSNTPGAKTKKKKGDGMGDLDGTRSQLVQLEMANARVRAEINGTTEAFDQNSEAIEDNFRKEALAIRSKGVLNKLIGVEKKERYTLRDALKEHNKQLEIEKRNTEALSDLHHTVQDQTLQAAEALAKLNSSYNGVSLSVERYIQKLRDKYKEQLKSPDPKVANDAERSITDAGIQYSIELLSDEAVAAKKTTEEITDGLLTEDQLRQKNYTKEVDRVNALIVEAKKIYGPEGKALLDTYYGYLESLRKKDQIEKSPFGRWALEAADLKKNVGDALSGALDGFIDNLAEGKFAFGQFAKALLIDLAKIIIKAVVAKTILSALGIKDGASESMGSGIGKTLKGIFKIFAGFHEGGVVGGKAPGSHLVNPGVFAFAKKYHNGGFPGLRSDEVPIIAQKGEGVFTKEQMKVMGSGNGTPPQINIINQTDAPVDKNQINTRFDGEKFVVDVILKHANKPGPIRELIGKK